MPRTRRAHGAGRLRAAIGLALPARHDQRHVHRDEPGGLSSSDTIRVVVRDTTGPEIRSLTASPSVIPATGVMTPVALAVSVVDAADPSPACLVTRIASSVKDLDRNGVPDASITGPLTVLLEAATRKRKDRSYTITVRCTDASGNTSKERAVVVNLSTTVSRGCAGLRTRGRGGVLGRRPHRCLASRLDALVPGRTPRWLNCSSPSHRGHFKREKIHANKLFS